MHAARMEHLRQEHGAELAGADQADGDGPAGGFPFEQQGVKIHEAFPPHIFIAGMTSQIARRRTTPYWQIARETKDSSVHSCGFGARPSRHICAGHL